MHTNPHTFFDGPVHSNKKTVSRTQDLRGYYERSRDRNPRDLFDFLLLLEPMVNEKLNALYRSLLYTTGCLIHASTLWEQASQDALLDCPIPLGNKRTRRLDPEFRRALGLALPKREGGATATGVRAAVTRFRRWGSHRFGLKLASNAVGGRVMSYINLALKCLHRLG